MPLTDTAIRKAKPRDKPRKIYDSRGLYLEIAPRGTKAWRFKYRFAEQGEADLHGHLSRGLAEARPPAEG